MFEFAKFEKEFEKKEKNQTPLLSLLSFGPAQPPSLFFLTGPPSPFFFSPARQISLAHLTAASHFPLPFLFSFFQSRSQRPPAHFHRAGQLPLLAHFSRGPPPHLLPLSDALTDGVRASAPSPSPRRGQAATAAPAVRFLASPAPPPPQGALKHRPPPPPINPLPFPLQLSVP
jgi:hypothetical protein